MKVKAFALLLVAAILLSGCASKKGDGDDDDGTGTGTSTKTGTASGSGTKSSTGTTSGGSSGPGTITVAFTRSTPDGAIPLSVNFTLGATFKAADGKPATPASVSWSVAIRSGNATNATETDGPTGTSLPANFTLNFTTAGNRTVVARVSAPGFTSANATILIAASEAGDAVPLFFDGGEGDASQFAISSNVWFYEVFTGTEEETDAEHPSGAWAQSTDAAHSGTKSWFSQYPDNYRTRMETLTVKVPAGGATLSYWVKGGAEANGVDGLHVLVNDAEVVLHNAVADWTKFSFPVPAGDAKILFRFDSDMGCSDQTPGPAGDPSGSFCGGGFDLGGLYVDDITVA